MNHCKLRAEYTLIQINIHNLMSRYIHGEPREPQVEGPLVRAPSSRTGQRLETAGRAPAASTRGAARAGPHLRNAACALGGESPGRSRIVKSESVHLPKEISGTAISERTEALFEGRWPRKMLLLRADGTHGARTAPRRACRRLGGSATRSSGRRQRQLLASKGATRRERAGLTPAGGHAPCARHPGFRGGKRPRPRPRARAAREPGALTGEHGDTGTRTRWRCASWPSRGDPDTTGEAASLDLGSEDGREGRTDAGRTARSRPREETGRGVLTRSGAQPWRGAGPAAEGGRGDADSHCVSGSQPGGPGAAGTAAFPTPNTRLRGATPLGPSRGFLPRFSTPRSEA